MIRSAFFCVLLSAWSTSHAETLYVKSPTADLRSSTDATATIITQLKSGTKVLSLEKKGKWYRVSVTGTVGWIYEFKLSPSPPSTGGGLFAGLGGGGATAREGSTAASVRGLSPTSEKYAGRAAIKPAHVQMIKHMEGVRVSSKEMDAFLKEGKLGEYGAEQ